MADRGKRALTQCPDLMRAWNWSKNQGIDPAKITAGSNQKVWWRCQRGHEWQAGVSSRTAGRGCPVCNKERNTSFPEQAIFFYLQKLFPQACNRYLVEKRLEVDIFIPAYRIGIEYDGSYYHRSARKQETDAKKNRRLKELQITLIRVAEEGTTPPPDTEHVIWSRGDRLEATIRAVLALVGEMTGVAYDLSVDISRDSAQIWEQYVTREKENSILSKRPDLLREWHPTKNGALKPEYISCGSNKRLWWKCTQCGYEWRASAANRVRGTRCPVCTGNIVAEGRNDLCTTHPELVREWDLEKNGGLLPSAYSAGSGKYVWWKCATCGYEWKATIANRTRNRGCPRCIGKVVAREKSLASLHPELAEQWCAQRNGGLTPWDVLPHSDKKVWWECAEGHVWEATVSSRVQGNRCPYCGNKRLLPGYNDLATRYPELAEEWDESRNALRPTEVFCGSNKKVYWLCKKGHSWQAAPVNRVRGTGCPYCAGKRAIRGENDLKTKKPLLAEEWDQEKNGELTPEDVTVGSNRKVWWRCKTCGYGWQAIIWSRCQGRGCPRCAGKVK